jgi:hypothetical protein
MALFLSFTIISCHKDDDHMGISDTGLCLVEINGQFEDVELDVKPAYLDGGYDGFVKRILEVVKYPVEARENNIQGECTVNYEITEQGTVENIVAIQDPGGGIGESAVKALESITAGISFSPGILNGIPVRVQKQLKIKYVLQ